MLTNTRQKIKRPRNGDGAATPVTLPASEPASPLPPPQARGIWSFSLADGWHRTLDPLGCGTWSEMMKRSGFDEEPHVLCRGALPLRLHRDERGERFLLVLGHVGYWTHFLLVQDPPSLLHLLGQLHLLQPAPPEKDW